MSIKEFHLLLKKAAKGKKPFRGFLSSACFITMFL
jgi:hypothetical protein